MTSYFHLVLCAIFRVAEFQNTLKLRAARDIPQFEVPFLRFIAKQVNHHLPAPQHVTADFWPGQPELRKQAVEAFELENRLYLAQRDSAVVHAIESTLGGNLYFRKTGVRSNSSLHLELVLVFGNQNAIPYSRWSDGQKAFCFLSILLEDVAPDIMLLDELENHLHPSYMSKALEIIRQGVPQSLITTHHPHLIFSELVDRVIYLDTDRNLPLADPPLSLPYKKILHQLAPSRRVVPMRDDFGRISASYRLFLHQDKQLLKQASLIAQDTEMLFYSALRDAFTPDIVAPKARPYPDAQSKQFADFLTGLAPQRDNSDVVTVLDFGAGLGRLPLEITKERQFRNHGRIHWICWDPNPKNRARLLSLADSSDVPIRVPEALTEVAPGTADVCVLANLAHELSPQAFADAIQDGTIRAKEGASLVLLELFPLIHPERFAVPYPMDDLADLLHELGFSATSTRIAVHGVEAYIIAAIRRSPTPGNSDVVEAIVRTWERLKIRAVRRYSARRVIVNLAEYVDTLQDLCTIASVDAYHAREWM